MLHEPLLGISKTRKLFCFLRDLGGGWKARSKRFTRRQRKRSEFKADVFNNFCVDRSDKANRGDLFQEQSRCTKRFVEETCHSEFLHPVLCSFGNLLLPVKTGTSSVASNALR